jgi:hypothetical protein
VDHLDEYSRLHLIDLLNEMIVDKYGKQYNLYIDPFSPLLIQQRRTKGNKEWLDDIHFNLQVEENTYNTSIQLLNSQ